jgi:hypothetical protein
MTWDSGFAANYAGPAGGSAVTGTAAEFLNNTSKCRILQLFSRGEPSDPLQ